MISIPTTLILGAGSSEHLGYPIGSQLTNKICESILREKYNEEIDDLYSDEKINDFCRRFCRSAYYSIDTFLEKNRDLLEIGKLFIADCLKRLEDTEHLFPPYNSGWYQVLFNAMTALSVDELGDNKLTVITFNYDRSIEAYLHQAIMYRYQVSEDEAARIVNRFNIIHPHGNLGQYPRIPYSTALNSMQLRDIIEHIKIIHEIEDSSSSFCSEEFRKANEALKESQKIYFLGFRFHEDNIRRFQFFSDATVKGKEIYSTFKGIAGVKRKSLLDMLSKYGISAKVFTHDGDTCDRFFVYPGTFA